MDTQSILADYIRQEIMRNRNAKLNPTDDLLGAGILDSLGILQLVGFIEERFGLQVPDEDVVYENFNSLQSLSDYLAQLKASKA